MARALSKRDFFARIGYQPLRWQWQFHNSSARFRSAVCGRRTGKSHAGARDMEPYLFLPNKRYWIVGPTYDLGEKEFRVIWDDLIVRLKMAHDSRIKKSYNKKAGIMYIEFPWHTLVEVRSADHPEALVGEALDGVIMSEAAKHKQQTWERMVRPALSDKRGWGTFLTTPEGFNWLYDLWMLGQNPEFPDFESWRFPSWENEIVYPGGRQDSEIVLLEKTTTSAWFQQEIGAEFGAFVGKIFPEWKDEVYVQPHVFRPDWPNYMGIDWGWTSPFAAVEFQISPDDRIHIWREHYQSYKTVKEHCQLLKKREQPEGYHLDLIFGDAADPGAALTVTQEMGVYCIADPNAKKDRTQGYELLGRFLKTRDTGLYDEWERPIEIPGLTVDFKCPNTIREFNNLKAPEEPSGNRSVELQPKQDDHAIDALRYALMHMYVLGFGSHLTDVLAPVGSVSSDSGAGAFTLGNGFGALNVGGIGRF